MCLSFNHPVAVGLRRRLAQRVLTSGRRARHAVMSQKRMNALYETPTFRREAVRFANQSDG
jgi:hypothetical protein